MSLNKQEEDQNISFNNILEEKPEINKESLNNFELLNKNTISFEQENEKNNTSLKGFIPFENKILIDEIFFDGNSDTYDMILNFESFEQLKQDGWNAYFSQQGWKKYKESINSENIIIGVVGIKNRGKSYLLKRIMNNENYQANDGFLVSTFGISCSFPVLKNEHKCQTFVTLDTAGRDNPLLQSAYTKDQDIRTIIKDKKVCEILLSDFIIKECNVLIAVVEQLSFAEQEMMINLINRLRLKEVNSKIDKRKLIIIHNLMNINKTKDIKKFINDTLLRSMTFSLDPHPIEDEDTKYNLTVYDQIIENDDNFNLDIVHVVIGNDKIEEIRNNFNEPVFKYIRDYITIADVRKFDIIKSFKNFIEINYKQFINTNLFDNNPLEIGAERNVKVYSDEEKMKTADKILMPISIKDKIKINDLSFKNFYFDPSGIYYSAETLYSAKIIEKEKNKYLEITFEMYGKLKDIITDVNYDENNNKIIIEIKGKTEKYELDFFKNEEIYEKEVGNLKYKEFDFQVILDKFKTIKNYEIEIENYDIKPESDEDTGIHTLLFPISVYEI